MSSRPLLTTRVWKRVSKPSPALVSFVILMLGVFRLPSEVIPWPLTALDLARDRALAMNCVSHLKQTMVAARQWSLLHSGQGPLSIQTFTNELESPVSLFCPANVAHLVATNWQAVDWSQVDYEWLPDADWYDANAVACRCRVHDTVGRVDGTVQWRGGYQPGWPVILAGPLRQEATPGSLVRFAVELAPETHLPVAYQWRRHRLSFVTNVVFFPDADHPEGGTWETNRHGVFSSNILSGQTNASLVLADVRVDQADYYSVVVSNAFGAAASHETQLGVDTGVDFKATNQYWSTIHCVNNLKQIAVFGQIWANDRDERLPSGFELMTNSSGGPIFGWPVVLYCRFDATRKPPADWSGVNLTNTSYEIVPSGRPIEDDLEAPFVRCRVHGFYARADGAVVHQPRFTRIRALTPDTTELNFDVFAGQTSALEGSSDLVRWERLNAYSTVGSFSFVDTPGLPQRFYRIRTE